MSDEPNLSEQKRLELSAKVARDGADVTSGGRQFHTWGPAAENARMPTVER